MDVDTLKKVNALAKSLQEQGLAANMEDAMRLASGMVGNEEQHQFSTDAATQMKVENNTSTTQSVEPENISQNEEVSNNLQNLNSQPVVDEELKKEVLEIKNNLQNIESQSNNNFKFIQQIGNEIDKIYEKLSQVVKSVEELKNKPSVLQTAEEKPTQVAENKEPENSTPEKQNGDLTPDNIDIRKYFYSGN